MIIKCLLENTTNCPDIISEHGLSLYIETKNHKILFDMGQTDLFKHNAEKMGVELSKVDIAILSHGHYDHGGGIETFLEINKTAPIYISKYAFEPHYNGKEKYIGLNKSLLTSSRFIFTEDDIKIDNELTLFSSKNLKKEYPVNPFGLNMIKDGNLVPEDFRHEQYLVINESNKNILFSGCSHNGILNIEKTFSPNILIGGFHFSKLNPETSDLEVLKSSAKILSSYDTTYYTCHCTGISQFNHLKKYMKNKLFYISSGETITI